MSFHAHRVNGDSGSLAISGLTVRLPGESKPVLDRLEIELDRGDVLGICGRSGAGKTTLLHAIAGLVPWFRPAAVSGRIMLSGEPLDELDPGQRAHLMGTCLDRPDAQLFLPMVEQELAAARSLYGGDDFSEFVNEALGVNCLEHRRISELSSGQRQRVALAVALAACPRPVVLDEPTAHLDSDGVVMLQELVRRIAGNEGSLLINEQAGWRFGSSIGDWLKIADGSIGPCNQPSEPRFSPPFACGEEVVLAARGLNVRRGGRDLIDDIDLVLRAGEIVLLTGQNGAGKSTLAQTLAGIRRPEDGRIECSGDITLMLPSSQLQLFERTVASEVSSRGRSHEESARVLRRHRLDHLAARAPWTLSRGEQQRLVHSALDLMRPDVMIVDEPGQGLDPADLESFVDLIQRRAEKGRAYLVISHRLELAGAAHRHLRIVERRLEEVGP